MKRYARKFFLVFLFTILISCYFYYSLFAQTSKEKTEDSGGRVVNLICESGNSKHTIQQYKDAGLHEFLNEICLILLAKEKYEKIKRYLMHSRTKWFREHQEDRGKAVPVSEDMKKFLGEIRANLQNAINGFEIRKGGVVNTPEKLIGQLIRADVLLSFIERGSYIDADSIYGYDVDIVDQRMDLALKYSLIWVQEGFE